MAYTFTYVPSKRFTKSSKPRVLTAQFGDGYSQRVGDGINRIVTEWSLSFASRSITEINNIISFLEARSGVEAFKWTPPGESTQYAVICPEWSKTYDSPISATIQARFVQVFDKL